MEVDETKPACQLRLRALGIPHASQHSIQLELVDYVHHHVDHYRAIRL